MAAETTAGHRIREARKRLGMTQTRLGELVGTHLTTVNRWEKGHQVPEGETLGRLAQALHVEEGWILRGDQSSDASALAAVIDARTREAFDTGFRSALDAMRAVIEEMRASTGAPAVPRAREVPPVPTAPAEALPASGNGKRRRKSG